MGIVFVHVFFSHTGRSAFQTFCISETYICGVAMEAKEFQGLYLVEVIPVLTITFSILTANIGVGSYYYQLNGITPMLTVSRAEPISGVRFTIYVSNTLPYI